jgi:rod shape-determining protein MreD
MTPSDGAAEQAPPLTDIVRLSVVVVVALVAQQTLVDAVQLHGAHADLLLLVTVAAGYLTGPDRGAGIGFVVGLVADLFTPTTFGLSALVDCLLGYGAGLVGTSLASSGLTGSVWWPAPAVLAVGAAAGTTGYGVLAGLLGVSHVLTAFLPAAVVMTALGGVVLGPLVTAAVRWAVGPRGVRPRVGPGGSASAARTRSGTV